MSPIYIESIYIEPAVTRLNCSTIFTRFFSAVNLFARSASAIALLLVINGCSNQPVSHMAIESPIESPAKISTTNPDAARIFENIVNALSGSELGYAEEQLLIMIDRYPERVSPYINLGIIYRKTGRPDQAREMFLTAISLIPEDCTPRIQLGLLEREQLNLKAAENAYQGCLEVEPENTKAYLNIGILYELYLGDFSQAVHAYDQYRLLSGSTKVDAWIADLERRIDRTSQIVSSGVSP